MISSALKYIFDKNYRFEFNALSGFYNHLEDKEYLEKLYAAKMHKPLNLSNPETFNEKLNWLKLYDRKKIYTSMVDKYEAKNYVSKLIGDKYVVPLIGVWNSFDEIDIDCLPNQFVLKTTHGCGGMCICKDKNTFDFSHAKKVLNRALRKNYFLTVREWPYKNVVPRIIAEQYLEDKKQEVLVVYKVFNFNGEPKIIQVIQGDKTDHETIDYFDNEWNLLDLRQNFQNSKTHLEKPALLGEMLSLSRKCSLGHAFLRTDWYLVDGKIYFSEFTFYSDAGMEAFHPDEWDMILGKWIKLPEARGGDA